MYITKGHIVVLCVHIMQNAVNVNIVNIDVLPLHCTFKCHHNVHLYYIMLNVI